MPGRAADDSSEAIETNPLRLVLLTRGTSHAAAITDALLRAGLDLCAVVFERRPPSALRAELGRMRRRRGLRGTARAVVRRLGRMLAARRDPDHWSSPAYYERRAAMVEIVPSLNGTEAVTALRRHSPDIVILGGAPILRGEILGVARLGTINAHPGLLPAYRGMDVIPWAVLNGDRVGVTVHLVDTGIDTGGTLRQAELPIGDARSIQEVQARAEALAGELVAETVREAARQNALRPLPGVATGGRLYRAMSQRDLRRAASLLRAARR